MLFEDDALKFVCPLLIKSVDVRILGILRWTKSQLMGYSHCSDTKLKIIRDLQILNLWAESLALSSGSVQHPTSKEEEKAARKKSWENDNGGGGNDREKELTFLPRAVILCRQVFLSILASKSHSSGSSVQCMSLSFSAGSLQFFPPMLNFKKFLSLTVLAEPAPNHQLCKEFSLNSLCKSTSILCLNGFG